MLKETLHTTQHAQYVSKNLYKEYQNRKLHLQLWMSELKKGDAKNKCYTLNKP